MRKPKAISSLLLTVVLATTGLSVVATGQTDGRKHRPAVGAFGKLPLYFVENRGVYADEVRYYIAGADKTLFFTDRGVTIALKGKKKSWNVKLEFVGANKDARPEGREEQQAVFSYFTGREKDWKAGLPTFSKVIYRELWPGIDLVYRGSVNKLKYAFEVAPGADPARIRLRYRGATSVAVTENGSLEVSTPEGSFEDAPPEAWQENCGERDPVGMEYRLDQVDRSKGALLGFHIGDYDRTRRLILDPAVLVYCGYLGGAGKDGDAGLWGGIQVDAAGNVYVSGRTESTSQSFPLRVGPGSSHNGGGGDVYVAKVNAQGTALLYCGYIGGQGDDFGKDIAVDAAGNAYVTGCTLSNEKSFPVKVGPDLTHNGGWDGFVAKVNAQGTGLIYCGYVGGTGDDRAHGIAVDASGSAYLTGDTTSNESPSSGRFPVKGGPGTTYRGGRWDAFVAKIDAKGAGLVYCGYIGGTGDDQGYDVGVDRAGNAYVGGSTMSSQASFPVIVGPDLTHNGGWDAFVAKVKPTGAGLAYCGYIGGAWGEYGGYGLAVDSQGCAYLTGPTTSDEKNGKFPVKRGPDLTFNGGIHDAYIAKVNAQGTTLEYCGYIGGSGSDCGNRVAVDAHGNAYVSGLTQSGAQSFPAKAGPGAKYSGGKSDAFVAKVHATGTMLVYCGYIGGAGDDIGGAVVADSAGNVYVTGITQSDEKSFPVTTGPDLTYNGSGDAFVAKIALTLLEASGGTQPGRRMDFQLTASDSVGLPYQVGSSFGPGPIPFGNRQVGLSLDPLLEITSNNRWPHVFAGYRGVVGKSGQAKARIHIPAMPALVGTRIYTAFVTVSPSAPFGLHAISNTFMFRIG